MTDENIKISLPILQVLTPKFHNFTKDDFNGLLQ